MTNLSLYNFSIILTDKQARRLARLMGSFNCMLTLLGYLQHTAQQLAGFVTTHYYCDTSDSSAGLHGRITSSNRTRTNTRFNLIVNVSLCCNSAIRSCHLAAIRFAFSFIMYNKLNSTDSRFTQPYIPSGVRKMRTTQQRCWLNGRLHVRQFITTFAAGYKLE